MNVNPGDAVTPCGHDLDVRCARCAADFDPVQPRRWARLVRESRVLTERRIKPDEARTALLALLAQLGWRLDLIREYDARLDRFVLLIRDALGKQMDAYVPGEKLAQVVDVARMLVGGRLVRPSEVAA